MIKSDNDNNKVKKSVHKIFTEYMKNRKLRKTPERYAVLDAIYSIDTDFDTDALYDMLLNEKKFRVSIATIYNTLSLLEDAHLVSRHQIDLRSARYERSYDREIHHHLVCTECGSTQEYANETLKHTIQKLRLKGFQMESYQLYLYGLCPKCLEKKERMEIEENKIDIQ